MVLVSSADHTSELWRQRPLHAQRAEGRGASGVGYNQTTRSHAQHVKKRAGREHVGQHVDGRTARRKPTLERLMECHDDRKRRTQALDKPRHHTAKTVCVRRSRGETDALANSDAGERVQLNSLGEHEQMDDPDEKKSKERTHSG